GIALALGLLLPLLPLLKKKRASLSRSALTVPAFALLGCFLVGLAPSADPGIMHVGVHAAIRSKRTKNAMSRYASKTAEVIFTKDGLNGTVAVVKNRHGRGELDLVFAGKWVASTLKSSRTHLHYLGHLPMLLSPKTPQSAVVVGMGAGITTGALLTYPQLDRVDLVELEPAVVLAADYFKEFNHAPLSDPRLHLNIEDGRTFLSFSQKEFDLITSDPIHPWVKGAANLYSLQYYQAAAAHLSREGIFAQWIPSSISKVSADAIVRSAAQAFDHLYTYVSNYEVILFASQTPIEPNLEVFKKRAEALSVTDDLRTVGTSPERLYSSLKKHLRRQDNVGRNLGPGVKPGQLNTDDNVFLEHRLPWDYFFDENFLLRPKKKKM
ncbi:MAG: hypothetical protein MK135_10305, partial [Polyangiaceae bacterium]|nr:hypothetical protein [Polyangiaceae bacterium]